MRLRNHVFLSGVCTCVCVCVHAHLCVCVSQPSTAKHAVHNINPFRSLLILVVWQVVWWWVLTISFPRWLCVTRAVSRTLGATSPQEQKWIKKFIQTDRWTDRQTDRQYQSHQIELFPEGHTHTHRLTSEDLSGNTKCCGYNNIIENPSQHVTS